MMADDIKRWIVKEGEKFLKEIGIKSCQSILDFGCGVGNYTIPAAALVGEKGTVYAVDKNKESLNELMLRAKKIGLKNIKRIDALEEIKLPLKNKFVDVVLLYDVFHLVESRERLLVELYRISKPEGLLSVFPRHHQEYMNVDLEGIKENIESAGFHFETKLIKTLMHDNSIEKGCVLNFRKR